LKRAFLLQEIPFPRMEQRLPTILSPEEVAKILTLPPHLKTRALLMTIYAAGLRRSEAAHLQVNDIDSARMTITVRQGKGHHAEPALRNSRRISVNSSTHAAHSPICFRVYSSSNFPLQV
jgi:integrase/recombinase XerD